MGQYTLGGQASVMILHDRSTAPTAQSGLDLLAKGANDLPLKNFSLSSNAGHFELQGGTEQLTFDGKRKGQGLSGTVTQAASPALVRELAGSYQLAPGRVVDMGPMDEIGGQLVYLDNKTRRTAPLISLSDSRFISGPSVGVPFPIALKVEFVRDRRGAVTGLRWEEGKSTLKATRIAAHRVEDVSVVNGDVTLKGTLSIPLSRGPHPAIVFAHGSGDATRNVGMWNAFYVRQGIAVLSLDKRGAGASRGDWKKAGMDDIAGDWLAGVAMLKGRSDIDPKKSASTARARAAGPRP